jgi:hypothetical protein
VRHSKFPLIRRSTLQRGYVALLPFVRARRRTLSACAGSSARASSCAFRSVSRRNPRIVQNRLADQATNTASGYHLR